MSLTLRPVADLFGAVQAYVVDGLPPAITLRIEHMPQGWQVTRVVGGLSFPWSQPYGTPEEALDAVTRLFGIE